MSVKALQARVDRLKRQVSPGGWYSIEAEVRADGTYASYWDGMKGCSITEEGIKQLQARGRKIVIREYPEGFFGSV